MLRFHNPRVSTVALELLPRILREQMGTTDRLKGQIMGLPVYQSLPSPKLGHLAQNAQRVGWRYFFRAEDESGASDAIIEFGRSEARKPFLKSFTRSVQPRVLVSVLEEFEVERVKDDIAFYIQILSVPALKFELVWFKDARKNGAKDEFRLFSQSRFGGDCVDELAGRFAALPPDAKDDAAP